VKAWAFVLLGDEVSAGVGDGAEAGLEGAFGVVVFEAIEAVLEPGLEIEAVVAANEKEGEQETTEGGDEGEEALLEGEEGGGLSGWVGAAADGLIEGEVELLDDGQRSIWQAVAGVSKLKGHGAYSEPGLREQTSVRICPVCLVDREGKEYCPEKGREWARVSPLKNPNSHQNEELRHNRVWIETGCTQEILRGIPGVERVRVFGSRTKGTAGPTSDLDVALFGKINRSDPSTLRQIRKAQDLARRLGFGRDLQPGEGAPLDIHAFETEAQFYKSFKEDPNFDPREGLPKLKKLE
jgi:predicted nucleotidyltransferase